MWYMLACWVVKTRAPVIKCAANHALMCAAIELYNTMVLCFGIVSEHCTPESCPEMSAGPKATYFWAEKGEKPVSLPAPECQYTNAIPLLMFVFVWLCLLVCCGAGSAHVAPLPPLRAISVFRCGTALPTDISNLVNWISKQLDDEKTFPAVGAFPKNFKEVVRVCGCVVRVWRRGVRVMRVECTCVLLTPRAASVPRRAAEENPFAYVSRLRPPLPFALGQN